MLFGSLAWGVASRRAERSATKRHEERAQALRLQIEQELTHLVQVRLPACRENLVDSSRAVPGLLHPELSGSVFDRTGQAVLGQIRAVSHAAEVRTDEAAQEIVRTVATRMRTQALRLEQQLEQAQHILSDYGPDVTRTLYGADHLAVNVRRLTQLVAVVCGGDAGLARTDTRLADLAASAHSRLESMELIRRIQLVNHLNSEHLGVVAPASEPVAMILAEVMANAAYFTAGSMPVQVDLYNTGTGAAVVITDSGRGLDDLERQRYAQRMLESDDRLMLTELGSPPRLGLAAIHRLAHRFPVEVTLAPSPSGGVAATVHLPASLLVQVKADVPISAGAPIAPVASTRAEDAATEETDSEEDRTGLPRRRRRAPAARRPVAPAPASAATVDAEAARARYAGLQAGAARGRTENPR
ncbi:hypothetical protein B1H18_18875 [Streptomyces tsukubensis]|uniref:histidine kinase n=1 Tax=Streptomyces tsukubensis TaxID=83656 RepID=A0A1V4A784_9ACTN|nr:hypothetical protein B1H18_18875 [Streptomyces tsukubensis]